MFDKITKQKDNPILMFLLLFTIILVLQGWPVPSENEFIYLLRLKKRFDPSYLLNDWTFAGNFPEHWLFNVVFGPLTLIFPLKIVGWFGRTLCWSSGIIAFYQLGRYLGISRWMTAISVSLWLLYGQALIAHAYIIQAFQASCLAYVLLLWAFVAFFAEKHRTASVLLGLCFSFHPSVGLFGIAAFGLAVLFSKLPANKLFEFGILTILFALPGLLPLISSVTGKGSGSADDWKFIALAIFPNDLNPSYWPLRDIILIYVLFLFNWLHSRKLDKTKPLRFIIYFQLSVAAFFTLGLVFRYTDQYQFLKYGPCRLFPPFVLLFFFFQLMNAFKNWGIVNFGNKVALVGLIGLLSLGNPIATFYDRIISNYTLWTRHEDNIEKAFRWMANNTPNGSVAILPPWRFDSWYLTNRAQVVSLRVMTIDRIPEWRERATAVLGGNISVKPKSDTWGSAHEPIYNDLTEDMIDSISNKYGASYFVTKQNYNYPTLYASGSYKVYHLVPHEAPGSQ